jgi:hypothetical protein
MIVCAASSPIVLRATRIMIGDGLPTLNAFLSQAVSSIETTGTLRGRSPRIDSHAIKSGKGCAKAWRNNRRTAR